MQKFLNQPDAFVDEMLEGLALAHAGRLRALADEPRAIVTTDEALGGRVAIATGGGSGHLPLFVGYVANGLVDGCAVGNLFASPSTDQMLAVTRAIHSGHGVLYLYGNYAGDRMNFNEAADIASSEGIMVRSVRAADDVASAPLDRIDHRRGIAGIFFGFAIARSAALAGCDLAGVADAASLALANTRSMGVALAPCILPTVGRANFSVTPGEMEIGMGIHGEPGTISGSLATADVIADELVHRILDDLAPASGSEVAVLVNGLGATPPEELYILYRRAHARLVEAGLRVHRVFVGEYATSLEMAGASISVMKLDDQLTRLLDALPDHG